MHFNIKAQERITKDELWSAIEMYISEKIGSHPTYCLLHPKTKFNFERSIIEDGMQYTIYDTSPLFNSSKDDEPVKLVRRVFGIKLLTSEDVKPNLFILCG